LASRDWAYVNHLVNPVDRQAALEQGVVFDTHDQRIHIISEQQRPSA
jgi:hypothetical protein